jgi:hypothetical protein
MAGIEKAKHRNEKPQELLVMGVWNAREERT